MDTIATSATWNYTPIDNPKRIELELNFTDEQFSKQRTDSFHAKWKTNNGISNMKTIGSISIVHGQD